MSKPDAVATLEVDTGATGAFLAFLTVFFFLGACVHWQVSRGIAFASLHAIETHRIVTSVDGKR